MKLSPLAVLLTLLGLLAGIAPHAAAQVKIGVVSSATGAMSAIGRPHENAASLLPRRAGDLRVDYILRDDESGIDRTQEQVRKLIEVDHVDAIIGPTGTPNALAVIPLVAEAGVPLLAPVGSSSVVLPMDEQKRWVFKTTPNDGIMAEVLAGHMTKTGIRSVALLAFDDAYGERWIAGFSEQARAVGLKIAAVERFRGDTPADAAVAKVIAADPGAVLIAGTGLSALAPHLALVDRRFKGAIYHTHAAASQEFLQRGDKKIEGAFLAVSPMLAINELAENDASMKLARGYIAAYERRHGAKALTWGANVYDAGLLLHAAIAQAVRVAKPGTKEFRTALRDALERMREFPATQGVFTLSPADHSGLDKRSRVMVTIRDHAWKLVRD